MPHFRQGGDLRDDLSLLSSISCDAREQHQVREFALELADLGALLQKLMMPMVRCSFSSISTTSCSQPSLHVLAGTPPSPKAIWPIRSKKGAAFGCLVSSLRPASTSLRRAKRCW